MDEQKKYIDAEQLIESVSDRNNHNPHYAPFRLCTASVTDLQFLLKLAPAADVQPVKRGRWIERNPQNSDKCRLIECDQCGNGYIVGFNVSYENWTQSDNKCYCGKCGAYML